MEPVKVGDDTLYHVGNQFMVSVQKYNQAVRLNVRKYFYDQKSDTIKPSRVGLSLRKEDIEVVCQLPDDTLKKNKLVQAQLEE